MSTLLLRLAGPMQAWGTESQFEIRKTNREPTKSGIIGLLAAAMGLRRDEPLDQLMQLHFGVRVDREGMLLRDFHMVRGEKFPYATTRYYLSDAVFLVGVSCEDESFMQQLLEAVTHPAFPLFLGRRSCPPEGRVCLGLRNLPLEEALRQEPLLVHAGYNQPDRVRIILDAPNEPTRIRDMPVSFHPHHRQHTYRTAKEVWQEFASCEHDPMQELR